MSEAGRVDLPGSEHRQARVAALGVPASKVSLPFVRPGLVWREQLLDRLERAETPIIEIVAPAGFGKTTLAWQWCQRTSLPTAWLSLDRADNDPTILLQGLAVALDSVQPLTDDVIRRLISPAMSASVPLRSVAQFMSGIRPPFVLALDHLEAVDNPVSLDVVGELAGCLPPGARLVVASRTVDGLSTARFRAEGRVTEIAAALLAMDQAEARALVEEAGVHIEDDELARLVERTEGWPTGLYLAARAHRQNPDQQVVGGFGGRSRIMADYLRDEVLDPQQPDVASFLMRTSILDRLSGPLCDAVLGTTGSQRMLEALEASNLLIVPLDRTREWYRYHHYLQEFLQAELAATAADEVEVLHRRAAGWFEEHGLVGRAMEHTQQAGDEDGAARLVTSYTVGVFVGGHVDTVRGWIGWFEARDTIRRHPGVAILGGLLHMLIGHPAAARRLAESIEIPADGDLLPDGSPPSAWHHVLLAGMGSRGTEQIRFDAESALRQLSPHSPLRPAAYMFLAIGEIMDGRVDAAARTLVRAIDEAEAVGEYSARVAALGLRALLEIGRHDWHAAAVGVEHATATVQDAGLEDYISAMIVFVVGSRVAAHDGQVERAGAFAASAQRLRPLCTRACAFSVLLLVELAQAYLAIGNAAAARSILHQLDDILVELPGFDVMARRAEELQHVVDEMGTGSVDISSLTASELRVLPMLATHLTLQQIADRLYLSRHTVKSHTISIYRKAGASSRGEAVEILGAAGLLDPGVAEHRV